MFSVPGVAGVSGLHGAEDFMPLAVAAVANCDRLRAEIRRVFFCFCFGGGALRLSSSAPEAVWNKICGIC